MSGLGPYICSTISILAVMMASITSILLICPFLNKSYSRHIISLLTMLAVGCLCGDAIFHLIPHLGHSHSHGHSHAVPQFHLPARGEDLQRSVDKYIEARFKNLKNENETEEDESEYQQLLLNFDSTNSRPSSSASQLRLIPRVVWMILIGGVLHNLTDGLAVGASYAGSISGGISTTLAILFHEIPHEIGDFVILVNAGIRAKYAILVAALTYVASFIGCFAGVALGKELDIVEWIFGATAGMFLYIALVELLPETMNDIEDVGLKHRSTFIWQNVGFITGTVTMALIAVFEDRIKSMVGTS